MRSPLALAATVAVGLASGCSSLAGVAPVTGSATVSPPETVLAVRWRRLLTPPELIEYKPQEFAGATSDGKRVYIGSHGGFFWALTPDDGRVVWKKRIDAGVSSRPLYLASTDTLYLGGDDGGMYALDPATGKEKWVYRTKGPIQSEPIYDDGLLYFANGENRVYAVDAQSGAWKWQYEREAPESFTIRGTASPLAYGGRLYVGFADGYLAALNARTGDVIWARSLAGQGQRFGDVDGTPQMANGVLYVSSFGGGVYALEPADGAVKWRYEVEGAGTVAVERGRVYFGAAKQGLHCLDLEGRLVWRQSLAKEGELSSPVLVGARLLLVSASEGGTYVVDRQSGKLLQFFAPGKGVTAEPVSDGRTVWVLTNTGFFYSFTLAPGAVLAPSSLSAG